VDVEARPQSPRHARVLGRDEGHGAQDLDRALRHVAQVPDRRGDDEQRPAGGRLR
jgi:hypothetical protein